ncbi:fructosamine kinase PKL/CAK/FruK [Coprinopsis marcescibilis]|uniref:protein-ribulosamine 3-kinase n=1 Tax=Coprinopsis marcescibilis TaxID=230819 RepID=A0A5C3LDN3_COPMA|nr:fructosamine kinase PKL/CAK/FruK [Coprinopsis marcescibilis]
MNSNAHLPTALKEQLDNIDSSGQYSGTLPKIHSTSGRTYFVKEGSPSESEQIAGEAESLKAIQIAAPEIAPYLYAFGHYDNGRSYFISEYKDLGPLTTAASEELARRLATELHQLKSLHGFGFEVPTYCGPTRFENGWFATWEKCYGNMYQHLITEIRKKSSRYSNLCDIGDTVIQDVIPELLGGLVIQPVLLHGDLWSGNVGVDKYNKPIIYDPASFYGHNESDLAISRMFGGFPKTFFDTYFRHNPKTEPIEEYDLRGELYESFHYLNHTLIFGGHYASHAEEKMKKLIAKIASKTPEAKKETVSQEKLFNVPKQGDPVSVN